MLTHSVGLLLFLQLVCEVLGSKDGCVNALGRASPISTELIERMNQGKECVNALVRASPISTTTKFSSEMFVVECQCPRSGYSYFYDAYEKFKEYMGWCQCPRSGYSYFYVMKWFM